MEASSVGVKFDQTEKKWGYQPDGEDARECLSSKESPLSLLLWRSRWRRDILFTVSDDLTLAHLLTIMKRNGLVQRFKKLMVGVSLTWNQFGKPKRWNKTWTGIIQTDQER